MEAPTLSGHLYFALQHLALAAEKAPPLANGDRQASLWAVKGVLRGIYHLFGLNTLQVLSLEGGNTPAIFARLHDNLEVARIQGDSEAVPVVLISSPGAAQRLAVLDVREFEVLFGPLPGEVAG